MLFKASLLCLLVMGFNTTAIILLSFNLFLTKFGKKIFAMFLSGFADKYNINADPFKKKLFAELNGIKTDNNDSIKILEIGGGSGANFKYYTSPAVVDVVEPNPNFQPYWDAKRGNFNQLQINQPKQGFGENLGAAGIEDGSVDAVVVTLVLCSVNDIVECLKEIHRVLKPGGKFFFMEHIKAEQVDGTKRMLQTVLTQSGLWPFLFDGCNLDRDIPSVIAENTKEWSKVEQTKYSHPVKPEADLIGKTLGYFVAPHVMGVLVK